MDLLGLTEKRGQRASHLSGGQQRRLHAGMAIMHRPRLVFMDEPTVGADVEARSQILRAVRQLADEGAAVVYTSHYLAEFEELGSDIAILNEGRIVASGTLEEIISSHGRAEVTLEFDRPVASFDAWDADGTLLRHVGDEADPGSRIGEALASPALQGARLTTSASPRRACTTHTCRSSRRVTMSQLKQIGAMTRLNIRLQLTDPAPTLILTVIPLVLIPFMMPAFKSMLLADGYAGVTGAEQAVPSIAILFSFLAVQNIIGSFFNERSWGTWERLEASPTSRASILTGKALVAFLMQTVQIAVVLALGALIFGYRPTGSLVALAAILLSFSAVLSALGVALALWSRSRDAALSLSNIMACWLPASVGLSPRSPRFPIGRSTPRACPPRTGRSPRFTR